MNNNDITMKRHCVNSVQTTAMAAVKRFFCVFFILFAFVSNALAATVSVDLSTLKTDSERGNYNGSHLDYFYKGDVANLSFTVSTQSAYKLSFSYATILSDFEATFTIYKGSTKYYSETISLPCTSGGNNDWSTFWDITATNQTSVLPTGDYTLQITYGSGNYGNSESSYTANIKNIVLASTSTAATTFSVADNLITVTDENSLGLDLLSSAETFTVTGPNTSNPTYPSGSSTMDKFANGAVITYFNGYYYCMWQSSNEGEDSQDTWVAYSRSADGITWETPKKLVSDDTNNNVINTSGGWYVDKTNNKLIGYINNWTY